MGAFICSKCGGWWFSFDPFGHKCVPPPDWSEEKYKALRDLLEKTPEPKGGLEWDES